MKQKLLHIFLSPYFISVIITFGVILVSPDYFKKHNINFVNSQSTKLSTFFYDDLTNDSISEEIVAQINTIGNASLLIYKSNGDFQDQYNFTSKYLSKNKLLWFQDYDGNGFKEIYLLTQSNDSVFLNIMEPFVDKGINKSQIFVDKVGKYNNEYKIRASQVMNDDSFASDKKEIIFVLMTGFAGYPRNIYKYDLVNNRIIKSPHVTNSSKVSYMLDIDNDGKNEFLIRTLASQNEIDSMHTKRTDYSTWLTVLDDDLSFFFEPLEFKATGAIQLFPFKKEGEMKLFCFFRSKQAENIPSKLLVLSIDGTIEKQIAMPAGNYGVMHNAQNHEFLLNESSKGEALVFNNQLEQTGVYKIKPYSYIQTFDLNADGTKEWLVNSRNEYISIYTQDFKNEVHIELPRSDGSGLTMGLRHLENSKTQLYIQKDRICYLYSYDKNPLYLLRLPVYLLTFIAVFFIVWLITEGQKLREAKRRDIEKEISELQLKTIKNQVDPHFVFNAINTISEMTLMDNKLEADRFIGRFSGFMRDTLKHSDKISTSLKEELEYTENFIKLQQIRFNNSFDYQVQVDKSVNQDTKIPKHVLFCYVENAIKHGLTMKKDGVLKIEARPTPEALELAIEDNGSGIVTGEQPKKHSTGSGLNIMDKIFELYTKLYNRKIKHRLLELTDAQNNKIGIRVEIKISTPKK